MREGSLRSRDYRGSRAGQKWSEPAHCAHRLKAVLSTKGKTAGHVGQHLTVLTAPVTLLFTLGEQFNVYTVLGAGLTAFLWYWLRCRGEARRRARVLSSGAVAKAMRGSLVRARV